MSSPFKTLFSFIAGAAVGAGAYAFLRSREGREWTERMKKKASDLKKDAEDLANEAKAKMKAWEEQMASKNN